MKVKTQEAWKYRTYAALQAHFKYFNPTIAFTRNQIFTEVADIFCVCVCDKLEEIHAEVQRQATTVHTKAHIEASISL